MSRIRNLVRSVVSENNEDDAATSELDRDECMLTFFAEIKGLVNSAFYALYEEVRKVKDKDEAWRRSAMERGLKFMNNEQNEHAIIDSVVESENACRSLTRQYFSAMHAFLRETAKHRDLMHVNFVSFGTFIARLYRKLSGVPEMKDAYFTTMTYTEKDMLLRDVLRQVMHASILWPDSREVKPSSPPSFSVPIQPSDSVSNVSGKAVPSTVVGTSVANTVMSVIEPSRFSKFKTASVIDGHRDSVIDASSKKVVEPGVGSSTIQVKVSESNQHTLPRGPEGASSLSTTTPTEKSTVSSVK